MRKKQYIWDFYHLSYSGEAVSLIQNPEVSKIFPVHAPFKSGWRDDLFSCPVS